jgi:hypothetical protein
VTPSESLLEWREQGHAVPVDQVAAGISPLDKLNRCSLCLRVLTIKSRGLLVPCYTQRAFPFLVSQLHLIFIQSLCVSILVAVLFVVRVLSDF